MPSRNQVTPKSTNQPKISKKRTAERRSNKTSEEDNEVRAAKMKKICDEMNTQHKALESLSLRKETRRNMVREASSKFEQIREVQEGKVYDNTEGLYRKVQEYRKAALTLYRASDPDQKLKEAARCCVVATSHFNIRFRVKRISKNLKSAKQTLESLNIPAMMDLALSGMNDFAGPYAPQERNAKHLRDLVDCALVLCRFKNVLDERPFISMSHDLDRLLGTRPSPGEDQQQAEGELQQQEQVTYGVESQKDNVKHTPNEQLQKDRKDNTIPQSKQHLGDISENDDDDDKSDGI